MADILNAWLVLQHTSDDRVAPLGGCWGGNPYSLSELRDKANQYGGAFTSVGSVSVDYSTDGVTANVRFSTNKGEVSLSGSDFRKIFNLRAPGRIGDGKRESRTGESGLPIREVFSFWSFNDFILVL